MSVKTFEDNYLDKRLPGRVAVLEFKARTHIDLKFLTEMDSKELKYVFRRTLEDMRMNLLSEFDTAFMELKKED